MDASTLFIISGASRGLGAAMAQQCLAQGAQVILLARTEPAGLADTAAPAGARLRFLPVDLANAEATQTICRRVASAITPEVRRCWLINNAGALGPVANTAHLHDGEAISNAFMLNIGSVMLLSAAVMSACQGQHIPCRILNISSGAGRAPVAGWAVYGATKAAMDFYSRVLALENPDTPVVSLAPGVIDTDMQAGIRSTSLQAFPGRERFIQMHEQGELASARDAAERILAYLAREDFGTTVIDDIRKYS